MTVTIAFDISGFGSVTETLPEGFSYVSSDPAGLGDVSGQDVTFVLFEVPGNTFTYTVTASMVPGDYSFSGTVSDSQKAARDVGGDTAITVEPPPTQPTDPTATRTIAPASVMTGEEVTVTVVAMAYGDSGTLVETLPAGLAHVSGSGGTASGQAVTFNLTAADQTVTYMATASDTAGSYSISGVLTASDGMTADVGGATDVTVTEPPPPVTGPSATRSFSSSTVEAGGTLDVTITAAGYGDTGLVTETLPAGFSYVSSSPSGLGVDSGQEVSFVLIDLEDDTFTYTVTASDVPGAYSFSGTLENFEKTEEVTVGGDSSVTVAGPRATRSFSPSSVAPGGSFTVKITGADYGESGLVTETLPNGFSYVSSSPAGIAEVNGQMVSFVLLGANESFAYTVTAHDTVGTYSFDGELVDFEKDSYPVGGRSSVTVAELPPTALRTISETAVVEGDQFDVTVIAFNYGLAGTLVESLGAGLEYVSSNMADALIVNGQTLTYTLVGNNLSVTYTVEATQTGTHVISGFLQSFDRSSAPVQVSGANSVTVSSATQPPTGGGTYSGPATAVPPTATPEPTATSVPPTATSVPPTATSVPPTATSVPPTATSVPPTATSVPPTATSVPPTATSVPPTATATSVPPTATSVPPTATSVPPTATAVPPAPTATSVPPTATSVPPAPTATSVPPTATAAPPTATSVPPTATSVPPTATSVPPAPTATSVPPTVAPAPTPVPTVAPPPVEEEGGGFPAWAIILIILAVIVVAAGAVVYARQRMMAQQQQA